MAGVILDTSVCIPASHGDERLAARIRAAPRAAITTITVAELIVGIHKAPRAERAREEVIVARILRDFRAVPFDRAAARAWARLVAPLSRAVLRRIGAHDLLIAATAVSRSMAVATRDARSFPKIPGVRFEVW